MTSKDLKSNPATRCALVSPSNSADITPTRGISIAVAGDLKVTTNGGDTVTIPSGSLAAGIIHPLCVTRVFSTGTAATGIVAYW